MLKSSSGFTLIEILLSLSLLGLFLVTILSIYQINVLTLGNELELMEMQDSLSVALNRMSREVRQAKELHPDSNASSIKIISFDTETIEYSLEGNTLYRKKGHAVKQPVADKVHTLGFLYGPQGLVEIKVTGKNHGSKEISYTTSVRMRSQIFGF
ncbi:MAG: prepilin-type N-terminal cleavage/methylation domain-containing protein [Firmicutes bacterium]|nr:prepilin-type N-terminal cleavage/methylation domain-containing protein [Bacillota bacterium]